VRSIGGTAAITEQQYFSTVTERAGNDVRDLNDAVGMRVDETAFDVGALFKRLDCALFHRGEL
jgi:hypothetical protein